MSQMLPFSRGNVSIQVSVADYTAQHVHAMPSHVRLRQSSDPFVLPAVNVNYFNVDFDLSVQIAGARLSRRILNSAPLKLVS